MGVSGNRLELSAALQATEQDIALAAACRARVLITGEEGVGKAAIARRIHESGPRAGKPFETVTCEGIADWMLAAQLFGQAGPHGLDAGRRPGAFERANDGTLFLDGIEGLSAGIQARLLRYVDHGEVQPIGADRPLSTPLDVRLIVSTSRPLAARVESGRFRPDLFYRLNIVHVVVPPLRHRGEDIGALFASRLRQAAGLAQQSVPEVSAEAVEQLRRYRWPGNFRELYQLADSLVQRCGGRRIEVADLPETIAGRSDTPRTARLSSSRRLVTRARDFTRVSLQPFALERARAH